MDLEWILLTNNVKQVTMNPDKGAEIHYAYTENMLSKNCLIEFFFSTDGKNGESTQTFVSVVTQDETASFRFLLYHEFFPVAPIVLSPILVNLVKFIDGFPGNIPAQELQMRLLQISYGVSSSHDKKTTKTKRKKYEEDREAFTAILEVIADKKAGLN